MNQSLESLRDEALAAYSRLPQSEAAAYLQAAMLAEIARHLEVISEALNADRTPGKLEDISTTLDAIRMHGLSVEVIGGH